LTVLGNIPIIEIGNPKIKDDGEKKGKIKYYKIKSIIRFTYNILDIPVNSENKDGLDKKIE
jgi:hypothetical protein